MYSDQMGITPLEQAAAGFPARARIVGLHPARPGERAVSATLRCVSSGYLLDDCSCGRAVPFDVVIAEWTRELERTPESRDRFFQFRWRGAVWLGFGLRSGGVRGVYCPEHRAEREARALQHAARSGERFATTRR